MIYICIPAFNEASTVGVLLWKIRRVMAEFPRDYELLVLDDGSTDGTAEVLAPYGRVLPLTVLHHKERKGYTASLERLLREAVGRSTHPKRDAAIILQGDFTEAPEEIPALIKRLEGGADVVEASAAPGADSDAPRALRWTRRGLPWLLRSAAIPEGARDPLASFRAYRISVLKRALAGRNGDPLLAQTGWAANAELLLAVAPHARRTEAVDVEPRPSRRQRETRFRAWPTVREVWNFSRTARRPAAAEPAES